MGKAQRKPAAKFEHGDKLTSERARQLKGRVDVPTPERVAKSAGGFEVSVLVEGDIPVIRVRERSLLTPPEVRRGMITEALHVMHLQGRFEIGEADIRIKETPLDRILNIAEHESICWYSLVHAKVVAGRAKIGNYGQRAGRSDGKGEDEFDRPLTDVEKLVHADLQTMLPEPFLFWLGWLSWHEYPGSRDGIAPSAAEVAKKLMDSRDAQRSQYGLNGYLLAMSQSIAHCRGEIETIQRRKDLVKKEIVAHRKKAVR